MIGWTNKFYAGFGKIVTGTLIGVALIGGIQTCNEKKERTPELDISINYGVDDKYTVRVFKEFSDTVISMKNNYIKGAGFKPSLVARGLTSSQYNIEILGFNIQNDNLLQSYLNRDKLIHLRDSIINIDRTEGLENIIK